MTYTKDTTVRFYYNDGTIGGNREEYFTLEELGIDVDNLTEEEIEERIKEEFEKWLEMHVEFGYTIEE